MKKIKIGADVFAMVDDDDFERASEYSWFVAKTTSKQTKQHCMSYRKTDDGEAVRQTLHHFVLNIEPNLSVCVLHKNRNGLDCRKANLKVVDRANMPRDTYMHPPKPKKRGSKFKGVYKIKSAGKNKWIAKIAVKGKMEYLGRFDNEEHAAIAYNKGALKIYGKKAYMNPVSDAAMKSFVPYEPPERTSVYRYVCWNDIQQRWNVKVRSGGEIIFNGFYINEDVAGFISKTIAHLRDGKKFNEDSVPVFRSYFRTLDLMAVAKRTEAIKKLTNGIIEKNQSPKVLLETTLPC